MKTQREREGGRERLIQKMVNPVKNNKKQFFKTNQFDCTHNLHIIGGILFHRYLTFRNQTLSSLIHFFQIFINIDLFDTYVLVLAINKARPEARDGVQAAN